MKVNKDTGIGESYTLGNYEKQVLIELDNELTLGECQRSVAYWPEVRSLMLESYDAMLSISLCAEQVKELLLK